MIKRFSSRRENLSASFIDKHLSDAILYDRIAGYFSSSMLEAAGEQIEAMHGKLRVVCNSDILPKDAETAKAAQHALRKSWCKSQPENLGELSKQHIKAEHCLSGSL